MSHTIYGDPTNFPLGITVPSDGDGPGIKAADVEVGFEGLMDRTAHLAAFARPLAATNFPRENVNGFAISRLLWNPKFKLWYAVDSYLADFAVSSHDPHREWTNSSELGTSTTFPMYDLGVVASSGAMVGVGHNTDSPLDTLWRSTAPGTWSTYDGLGGLNIQRPSITYDVTSGLWCIAASNQYLSDPPADVMFWTSPESGGATTWTLRTKPSGLPTDTYGKLCASPDALVFVGFSPSNPTNLYTARSTTGGATWSAATVTALGFTQDYGTDGIDATQTRLPDVLWTGAKFVAFACDQTTPKTKVFTSTNGSSWTLVATLTTISLIHTACVGDLIVADALIPLDVSGMMVYSPDAGTTWYRGGRVFEDAPMAIASNPGQFVITTGSDGDAAVHPGLVFGDAYGVVT